MTGKNGYLNNDEWVTGAAEWVERTLCKVLLGDPLTGWEAQFRNVLMSEIGPIPESPQSYTNRVVAENKKKGSLK